VNLGAAARLVEHTGWSGRDAHALTVLAFCFAGFIDADT
jgi:hypothetical protein